MTLPVPGRLRDRNARAAFVCSAFATLITALSPVGSSAAVAATPGLARSGSATTAAPLKIMPLGDSITMGIGSATMSSYRIDLQERLKAAGLAVDMVGSQQTGAPATADLDNEGHSGWTIAKIAGSVDGWLATYQPDAVLLMAGTNDLRTAAGAVGATSRLAALITQIKADAPTTEIFVAKITGTRNGGRTGQQKRTAAYNANVPGIVASAGFRVHLVDQSTVRDLDIRDGLHPNDFGYSKMSWNWYLAMRNIYNTGGPAWPARNNPYLATRAHRCLLVDADPGPAWMAFFDCRWWYLNTVTTIVNGKKTSARTWQTTRDAVATPTVTVAAHYAYPIFKGTRSTRPR
ncbi:MAG: hypothetical protein QOC94_4155 [Actinoplanes sp.]|nr:hypothetical protein [Actinoplanes sp.]